MRRSSLSKMSLPVRRRPESNGSKGLRRSKRSILLPMLNCYKREATLKIRCFSLKILRSSSKPLRNPMRSWRSRTRTCRIHWMTPSLSKRTLNVKSTLRRRSWNRWNSTARSTSKNWNMSCQQWSHVTRLRSSRWRWSGRTTYPVRLLTWLTTELFKISWKRQNKHFQMQRRI